jgi:hypothetical protein
MKLILSSCLLAGLFAFADEPKNLLQPTNKVESWRWEEHEGGKGSIKVDGDAIVFHVTNVTGTDWHVQAVQTNLDLKEGQEYTLAFKAKCDSSCLVGVNAMIDQEDWHQIGLGEQVLLGKEWQEHKFTFRAEGIVAKKNRISIVLGFEKATVSLKEMTLVEKK